MSSRAPTAPSPELIVLVHGFVSRRLVMRCLECRLRRRGFETLNWGYRSYIGSLERHASRLRAEIQVIAEDRPAARIHFVTHSMGGIIVRFALAQGSPPALGRIVMLAPPNRGSRIATFFAPLLGRVCPMIGELSDRPDSLANRAPMPQGVEIGVIAARFDCLAPASSTGLDGQADHIQLLGTHNSILVQKDVVGHVCKFIATGRFS